ncbi:MAG: CvpA family protein [candidate division WOR-3 bacterium]
MNIVDIVSSTLILISSVLGFFRGILTPFGYIFALILSFFLTLKNFVLFSNFLVKFIKLEGNLLKFLSFFILLLIIFSLIILFVLLLVNILKKTPVVIFDKIMGIIVWGFLTFLIVGGILNFLNSFVLTKNFRNYFEESLTLKYYKILIDTEIFKNVRKF